MKLDMLNQICGGIHGVRKDGQTFLVPDEVEVSVLIGLPAEVLNIGRVTRITATAELVTLETQKLERYYFATESVCGLKLGGAEMKATGRSSAGFR